MIYIVIILILGIAGEFLYFTKKEEQAKRYVFTLKRENDLFKERFNKSLKSPKSLVVKFSVPPSAYACILKDTPLYLCPLSDSPILSSSDEPMNVRVLCKAYTQDELWYEVSLISTTNINSRGWVKKDSIIFSDSADLTKV